jgi:hypothetical protein
VATPVVWVAGAAGRSVRAICCGEDCEAIDCAADWACARGGDAGPGSSSKNAAAKGSALDNRELRKSRAREVRWQIDNAINQKS